MALKEEKRRELDKLVGKQNADNLIQNLLAREKSAQEQGTTYKALDSIALDDINDFADAITQSMEDEVTEKAKKPNMAMAEEADMEEDDMEEADMEEDDAEEADMEDSLLTANEINMIADEVVKRMSSKMSEMKSMAMRTKSDDDGELVATLKAYTESQESFAAAMVDALEALDTRLKELSEAKSVFSPTTTHKNMVVDKDGSMTGLNEVDQAAYRMWWADQK